MPETQSDSDKLVTQFSGTRLDNVKTCCTVQDDGEVLFHKTREPRHQHSRFYLSQKLLDAISFGRHCAYSTLPEDILVVLEGKLPQNCNGSLDKGEPFPVQRMWLPTRRIHYKDLWVPAVDKVESLFYPKDPREMIRELLSKSSA